MNSFKNNIFYKASGIGKNFKIFNGQNTSINNLTFDHNTMINLHCNWSYCVYTNVITNLTFTDNLIFTNQTMDENCGLIRIGSLNAENKPKSAVATNNYVYKETEEFNWRMLFGSVTISGVEDVNNISDNPFENGGTFDIENETFIPNATYASYGAQR